MIPRSKTNAQNSIKYTKTQLTFRTVFTDFFILFYLYMASQMITPRNRLGTVSCHDNFISVFKVVIFYLSTFRINQNTSIKSALFGIFDNTVMTSVWHLSQLMKYNVSHISYKLLLRNYFDITIKSTDCAYLCRFLFHFHRK